MRHRSAAAERLAIRIMFCAGPVLIILVSVGVPAAYCVLVLPEYFTDPDYAPWQKGFAIFHIILVIPLAAMIIISLFCAWFSDPGATKLFLAGRELTRSLFPFITSQFIESLPRCPHCDLPKPARAHHCGFCDRCHLRWDHHCPAVGNCVALRNHRSFLVMLTWAVLGTGVKMILCMVEGAADTSGTIRKWFSLACAVIMLIMCAFLIGFLYDQMSRAFRNQTTIESIANEPPIYDIGVRQNLRQVYGNSYLGFLCPLPNDSLSGFEWMLEEYSNPAVQQWQRPSASQA
jgi:hypothetical protein